MEGFKREDATEAKVKRMLGNGDLEARSKVANAAASEGQRRSMYNKNNRFLVS